MFLKIPTQNMRTLTITKMEYHLNLHELLQFSLFQLSHHHHQQQIKGGNQWDG